jgi:rhamnogalacturonan endolyase
VAGAPNFEHQGWDYQYWTLADANGNFSLENVRPGNYTLHAFAEGIHGVYMGEPDAVHVSAGAAVEVGDVAWSADRLGPTVWELGRPDRTPREFYRGDLAWHYGANLLFPSDFPNGVDFTIGTSDPSKDWNYLQPGGAWTLRFNLEDIPADAAGASLVLDVAGSDSVSVVVNLNGAPLETARFPYRDGSISRDQPHGVLQSQRLTIDLDQLMSGENALTLTSNLRLMWDYIRLEWVTR